MVPTAITAFIPLLKDGRRELLCVNHEFLMQVKCSGVPAGRRKSKDVVTQIQVEGELAAHGHSILEIEAGPKGWQVVDLIRAVSVL